MALTHQVITCVKISHTTIIKAGIGVDVCLYGDENKMLYVMAAGGLAPHAVIDLRRSVRHGFSELGFVRNDIGTRGVRLVSCVKIRSHTDIYRVIVTGMKGTEVSPICLVIPSEVSSAEKDAIRAKIKREFPEVQIFEPENGGKFGEWMPRVGMVCGMLAMGGIFVASLARMARSFKRFVGAMEAEDRPPLGNVNIEPQFNLQAALWNSR